MPNDPMNDFDYSITGLSIQEAMVMDIKKYPSKIKRPRSIRWGSHRIQSADLLNVPKKGVIRLEFLSWSNTTVKQAVDISLKGNLWLADGRGVSVLRTWLDPQFENFVEYPYTTKDSVIRIWNVYEMTYPAGQVIEERMTRNAGFWIEIVSPNERIYHSSHGLCDPPDFESLVFRVSY
jgi:hypothetical protein